MYPDALEAAGRVEGLPLSSPQLLPELEEEEEEVETSVDRGPKRQGRYRQSLQLLKPFRITHKYISYFLNLFFIYVKTDLFWQTQYRTNRVSLSGFVRFKCNLSCWFLSSLLPVWWTDLISGIIISHNKWWELSFTNSCVSVCSSLFVCLFSSFFCRLFQWLCCSFIDTCSCCTSFLFLCLFASVLNPDHYISGWSLSVYHWSLSFLHSFFLCRILA